MNTKQLRQKILDLAIRGKLVPQDPNDEPASVLLERIKAEKEQLIKEGKIKRPKKSATTSDKPHYVDWELPNGWEWVKLSEICIIGTGATPSTRNSTYYKDGTIPWIGSSETSNEYIDAPTTLITQKALDETNCTVYPIGTLIMAMYGEGKTRGQISELRISSATNQACAAIVPIFKEIKSFIKIYLKGNYLRLRTLAEGGMQPNLNLGKISSYMIPMPPLAEQIRIERVLNDLLTKVDLIDSEKSVIDLSLSHVKLKILELAISGKLVPQDPADEPAADLLKRVNPNAAVSTDTSHYGQLPNGWCYTTMNYVCQLYDGEKIEGKVLINLDAKFLRGKSEGNTLDSGRYVPAKTTMILVDGENSGEIFTAPINGYQGSTFKLLNINGEMNVEYVKMIIRIYQKRLRDNKVGSAIPHLNKKMFKAIEVPVPPIKEQARIVEKVSILFSHIELLSECL